MSYRALADADPSLLVARDSVAQTGTGLSRDTLVYGAVIAAGSILALAATGFVLLKTTRPRRVRANKKRRRA